MTSETWKLQNIPDEETRKVFDLAVEAVCAAEPADVSHLFLLWYVAQAGNAANPGSLARLTTTAGGAQESRFVGGSQRISVLLARRLGRRRAAGRARPPHRAGRRTASSSTPTGTRCARGAWSSRCRRRSPGASPTTGRSPPRATSSRSACPRAR